MSVVAGWLQMVGQSTTINLTKSIPRDGGLLTLGLKSFKKSNKSLFTLALIINPIHWVSYYRKEIFLPSSYYIYSSIKHLQLITFFEPMVFFNQSSQQICVN